MNRIFYAAIAIAAALAVVVSPVHAKKPGSEESGLPKGLQKKVARGGELPPGWQKKLQKGAVLEPTVVSHGTPVSERIRVTLPLGQKGSIDITLDGKVVRLDEVTRKVIDVFDVRF